MVGVVVSDGATVHLVGHGISVERLFKLAPGISVSPEIVTQNDSFFSSGNLEHQTMAAVLSMERLANFSVVVEDFAGGERLAVKAWNALWVFSLLALACGSHVISLYNASGKRPKFSLTNRQVFIRPRAVVSATDDQLAWARDHYDKFDRLLAEGRFRAAQRYYNNSQYLLDDDAKIMLIWAGIESLLDVDQELRRRIALHAAILLDGNRAEKVEQFRKVKQAYGVRSKVVHGSAISNEGLAEAAEFASDILLNLLRKVVELGRLPDGNELDEAAASASIGMSLEN